MLDSLLPSLLEALGTGDFLLPLLWLPTVNNLDAIVRMMLPRANLLSQLCTVDRYLFLGPSPCEIGHVKNMALDISLQNLLREQADVSIVLVLGPSPNRYLTVNPVSVSQTRV